MKPATASAVEPAPSTLEAIWTYVRGLSARIDAIESNFGGRITLIEGRLNSCNLCPDSRKKATSSAPRAPAPDNTFLLSHGPFSNAGATTSALVTVTGPGEFKYLLKHESPTVAVLYFSDATVKVAAPKGTGAVSSVRTQVTGKDRGFVYTGTGEIEATAERTPEGVRILISTIGDISVSAISAHGSEPINNDPLLGKNVGRVSGKSTVLPSSFDMPRYRIRSITYQNAVLLREATSEIIYVSTGDEIPGYGKVKSLDPVTAAVVTEKGRILATSSK